MFILIATIAVVAFVAWFLATHERVSDGITYAPKAGVNANRYYTATELLGERASVLSGAVGKEELNHLFVDTDDASDYTVILYDIANNQKNQISSMIHWVEQGGHLVVFSQAAMMGEDDDYDERQNPLLVELGIDYVEHADDDDKIYELAQFDDKTRLEYIPLRLPDGTGIVVSGSIYGRFTADAFFKKYPNAQLYDYDWFVQKGDKFSLHPSLHTDLSANERKMLLDKLTSDTIAAQFARPHNAIFDVKLGQGRLTVLENAMMFTNPYAGYERQSSEEVASGGDKTNTAKPQPSNTWRLLTDGEYAGVTHNYRGGLYRGDNAHLLEYLTQGRTVYLVPDVESQTFGWVLSHYLPWTMIGLCLSVLLGLMAMPKRFGEVRRYQTDSATNIFGFFGHVGRYLWASDRAEGLMRANREALIKTIIASEFLADKQPSTIIKSVATKTGLPHDAVQSALYDEWEDEQEFLALSRYFAVISQHYQG